MTSSRLHFWQELPCQAVICELLTCNSYRGFERNPLFSPVIEKKEVMQSRVPFRIVSVWILTLAIGSLDGLFNEIIQNMNKATGASICYHLQS